MLPQRSNPHDTLSSEEFNNFAKTITVNALTPEQCNQIVNYGLENVSPEPNKHNRQFSKNLKNCFLPLNHELHTWLAPAWDQALDFFNFSVDFIEPYDLKFYDTNGLFSRHIDNYHGIDIPVDRKISMSLQLTSEDDYTGGTLIVGHKPASRLQGTATFFPSFYPHHVTEITQGSRWAVIGWAWGPYWR